MRHPLIKALALVLAALSLFGAFFFFSAAAYLLHTNLYEMNVAEAVQSAYSYRSEALAYNLANRYAREIYCSTPEFPDFIVDYYFEPYDDETISYRVDITPNTWCYTIEDKDGKPLSSTTPENVSSLSAYSYAVSGQYPALTDDPTEAVRTYSNGDTIYYLKYKESPPYRVTVYLQKDAITGLYGLDFASLQLLYSHRYSVFVWLGVSVVLFILCLVCLCITAGRRRKGDPVRPGGLNRLPLDLYLAGAGGLCALFIALGFELHPLEQLLYGDYTVSTDSQYFLMLLIISSIFVFLAALTVTAFLFALAAQVKAPEHYWWHNSILCRIFKLVGRLLRKAFSLCLRTVRWILEFYRLLPVMWQWLLTGFGILFMVIASIFLQSLPLLVLSVLICVGIIVYGAWAFGQLLKGAQQMAQGSLRCKVRGKYMIGAFQTHAKHLNALSDVTVQAADSHLRSERMKAELITNVSHDIKTPLTSIINYIDLLPRAENEEQQQEYLQILQRQSLRLKRLIEDLTEMSRASTGNIQTNIVPMDAVEGITQALGEFSDKLTAAELQVCTRLPEMPVMIAADGRLFWRVLSNLLSNVVKYAMPGTRVYVQLAQNDGFAQICVKNISREPLVKDARELTERFVRGDDSRNTEGSGLGLSIAGSLMDVQKGSMQVQVDADLFTATLNFPLLQP